MSSFDERASSEEREVERWKAALGQAGAGLLHTVCVRSEVDSTQDALRRLGASPGLLVAAMRQTAGRGRLGRSWHDGADQASGQASGVAPGLGVALSVALPVAAPGRLMAVGGLAALSAVDHALERAGGEAAALAQRPKAALKWPNDVLVDGRKIAGVLVEVADGVAIVGIGINVAQRRFPPELAERATSLALLGATTDRLAVASALVSGLAALVGLADAEIRARYHERDGLRGSEQHFEVGGAVVVGEVLTIDPLGAIRLRLRDGRTMDIDPAKASLRASAAGAASGPSAAG